MSNNLTIRLKGIFNHFIADFFGLGHLSILINEKELKKYIDVCCACVGRFVVLGRCIELIS